MSEVNQTNKNNKRKKRKKRKALRISKLSVLVFIISLIIIFNFGFLIRNLRGAISFGNVKIENTYSYEFKSNLDYKTSTVVDVIEDYAIIKDQNALYFYDSQMQVKWKKEINARDVIVKANSDFIIIANRLSGDIYTISKKGDIIGKKLASGKIEDIISDSSDNFLVYYEEDGIARLMDKYLNLKCEILIPGYNITNMELSKANDVLAISLYKVENETVFSSIMTYSLDGEITGIMNKEDQIIYDLSIVSDSIVVVTDKGVSRYNFENEPLFEDYIFERELSNFSIDEAGNVIANLIIESKDITDTRSDNVLVIINGSGKEILNMDVENTIQKITKDGEKTCYFAEGKLYIIDEEGSVLGIQLIKENPISIKWIGEDRIGILYNDSYDMFIIH